MENRQRIVYSDIEFMKLLIEYNGKCSIFISHNQYPDVPKNPVTGNPEISQIELVRVLQQYHDMDAKKLENALGDCRKLMHWCQDEEQPFVPVFSGAKGFQFLIKHEPAVYNIKEEVQIDADTKMHWSAYYTCVHAWMKSKLDLRTLDSNVAEPKRVMRVWNTMHFKRNATQPTGTFCIPLTPDQVDNWTIDEIVEHAKKPRFINIDWNKNANYRRFHDFLDEYDITPDLLSIDSALFDSGALLNRYNPGEGKHWNRMKALISPNGHNLCVLQDMWNSRNPKHISRFDAACRWKKLTVDPRTTVAITAEDVDNFYERMQYDDVINREERIRQIRSIYNRGPGSERPYLPLYEPPSCKKKYAAGICVGPDCPSFERYLGRVSREMGELVLDDQGNWQAVEETSGEV